MINLFINPYVDSRPERQKELEFCYEQNKANKYIDKIYEIHGRPNFRDFFNHINQVTTQDDINIVANFDIFFDETILYANIMRWQECYLISRWDVKSIEPFEAKMYNVSGSQDVWIFRGPVKEIKYCDYPMGKMGCDNRLAFEIHKAGYACVNPAYTIRCYHYHLTEMRNYDQNERSHDTVVPMPYQYVQLTALRERPVNELKAKYNIA